MFEVGDIIIGNSSAMYMITTRSVVCEVVEPTDHTPINEIRVRVISAGGNRSEGYDVRSDYFDLVSAPDDDFPAFSVGDEVVYLRHNYSGISPTGVIRRVGEHTASGREYWILGTHGANIEHGSELPFHEDYIAPFTAFDNEFTDAIVSVSDESNKEETKVTKVKRTPALQKAVESIKNAGFSHIKVEMEADLGRDGERDCDECDATGHENCPDCEGEGYTDTGDVTRVSGTEVLAECSLCYGDGEVDCEHCDGTGRSGSYTEESVCEEFLREWVPADVLERLTFGKFYEDGSVDSEFTFTVPIDNVEDVIVWMKAFNALAADIGEDMDTTGAGLHISIIPNEARGEYPCETGTLDSDGMRNFQSEITKLMPALFFLASSGHSSRDLRYRYPTVSRDKYDCPMDAVAVCTHGNSCIEYRVFETCYDRPERFYDFVQVIANTLKFYTDSSLKVKQLGKKFGFQESGSSVARFYDTTEQLRILNATVKHLKPTDKSYKKMKEERGVRYTIASLASREKQRLSELKDDYREYKKHWQQEQARPLTENQERRVNEFMAEYDMSRANAVQEVRGSSGKMMTVTQFIQDNLIRQFDEVVSV